MLDKSPEKASRDEGMNSNESFNENVGTGASSIFFTGFKGLFKRVIGATTNEMG